MSGEFEFRADMGSFFAEAIANFRREHPNEASLFEQFIRDLVKSCQNEPLPGFFELPDGDELQDAVGKLADTYGDSDWFDPDVVQNLHHRQQVQKIGQALRYIIGVGLADGLKIDKADQN